MTLSVGQSIAIIAVCAACTFLERWLPWLLFGRRAVPKVVEYLGKILPMAVMVSLLVYCLRGMQFSSAGAWVPQVIAVGVTAGLHWWRRNTLLSIAERKGKPEVAKINMEVIRRGAAAAQAARGGN